MPTVNLNDLREGMVTDKPVTVQNRVIVREGVTLTEKMLHLFKAWGVVTVDIAQAGAFQEGFDPAAALSEHEKKKIEETIDKRFLLSNTNQEIMAEVKRIATKIEIKAFIKRKRK